MFKKGWWKTSADKFKSTKYLAIMAAFIAVKVLVNAWYIPVGENLRVKFVFLFSSVEAAVLGPCAAMISSAITDIVGFMIAPSGPFFAGYTISAAAGALIYAMFFYKQKITLPKIFIAKALVNYLVNVLLGSVWSAMLYSRGYYYYVVKSLIKNTILLPFEVAAIAAVFKLMSPTLEKKGLIDHYD